MENENNKIKLQEILHLKELENVRVRFNIMFEGNWNPIEEYRSNNKAIFMNGQYHNYKGKKSFQEGQITIGLIRLQESDDLWLLFHVGLVTKDLNTYDGLGYEYQNIEKYNMYLGRVIVRFKNKSQNMIRKASSVFDDCEVFQILPDVYENDTFPGYDKVNVSWKELSNLIGKTNWITALRNQKAVYLITDILTGNLYVGSAYGDDMLLNRWKVYIQNGHGGNVQLKELSFDYIKQNFRYSILEIFNSKIDKEVILDRESWWKKVLRTRDFGYNSN